MNEDGQATIDGNHRPADAIPALVAATAGVARAALDDRLVEDLAMDSIRLVDLIVLVDQRFGVDLGLALAEGRELQTVGDLVDEVVRERGHESAPAMGLPRDVEPCFFPTASGQLYGLLQGPNQDVPCRRAVVLCQPILHEYWQSKLALRQVAAGLAARGAASLRFDVRGQGDSSSDLAEVRLDDWVADVHAAVDRLRSRAGLEVVTLAGLGLGASLAARAAVERNDVEALVLWNPVVEGAAYRERLETAHARAFEGAAAAARGRSELLGEAVTSEWLADLDRLSVDLTSVGVPAAILDGSPEGSLRAWCQDSPVGTGHHHLPERWDWTDAKAKAFWPPASVERFVSLIAPVES